MARVGVDVGGTNTDLVLEADHGVYFHKVASTPSDQSDGVLVGLRELCEQADVKPSDIDLIVHGTTVATNVTLENDGAEVGMITTRNFRDILHIGRHKRPYNFSLHFDVPWQSRPLIKRRNRIAVTECIRPPTGDIETPLNEDEILEAVALFKKRGIRSVVIGFMFSFLNDSHERRAKAIVEKEMPDAFVCASSDVANVLREYERFSTAAMNGFVGPRTSFYLNNLKDKLNREGFNANLRIIQSNGGIATVETCSQRAVTMLMSGPAGGVIGGKSEAVACNTQNIITVDIGGTSADISTITDGQIKIMNPRDTYVSGHPVLIPMIDLVTIGAGGGSIAYIDSAGGFHVGPRSAGADPGPACYGRGGERPTSADMHHWTASAIDLDSGEVRWSTTLLSAVPQHERHLKNSYASETPVTDGERLYVYFGNVGLYCLDFEGQVLWSVTWDPVSTRNGWGTAASPVLHDGRIYVVNDNDDQSFLAALSAETGAEVWRVNRDEGTNWSTPFVWEHEEGVEIVTTGTDRVRS